MAKKSIVVPKDIPSEEKIKNAARRVFHKKGFVATRTRDIAEEAGINLALLNYYFRSKKKLFDIIMLESLQGFIGSMKDVFNNETTSLENKLEVLVNNYINLLIENPDIPLFIFSEVRTNPKELVSKIDIKKHVFKSYFFKQFQSHVKEGKIAKIHPLHFMMNVVGMIVFPFIMSPGIIAVGDIKQSDFNNLMMQRKELIPKWVNAILKIK